LGGANDSAALTLAENPAWGVFVDKFTAKAQIFSGLTLGGNWKLQLEYSHRGIALRMQ
jgi:hypothetical protein